MVSQVAQHSFNGARSREQKQEVYVVTERAVFTLVPEGVKLIEIAPGIRLKEQILDLMDFEPLIAEDLKLMDEKLFLTGSVGLKERIMAKAAV